MRLTDWEEGENCGHWILGAEGEGCNCPGEQQQIAVVIAGVSPITGCMLVGLKIFKNKSINS